jgi:hypothetical protein
MEKNPHHLVMGELTDFLTGEPRLDTHDERFRQKIAQHLVQYCGYDKNDITAGKTVIIEAQGKKASLRVDFLVKTPTGPAFGNMHARNTQLADAADGGSSRNRENEKIGMMVRYAPGSLVTRRLPNLALSRIVYWYQIPLVVTTNGEDAEIIDGLTGKVTGHGLDAIPDKQALAKLAGPASFPEISGTLFEKASRIAYACEVDDACPCDTDVCTLDPDLPSRFSPGAFTSQD